MDVQLYVYDLSNGLARSMSRQLVGIQIDAVYHTSLVFNKVEYFFGAGVQTTYAGQTHHGRPIEIIEMGTTQLPMDVILEYLNESLKPIYTPESYDLFTHNCNNFSSDFALFLVGKRIPPHITDLPAKVLETPFGRMLRPQIDASLRSVTQANIPALQQPPSGGAYASSSSVARSSSAAAPLDHAHLKLRVPSLQAGPQESVVYGRVPPLDKLSAKLGPAANNENIAALRSFISKRNTSPKDAPLPDLQLLSATYAKDVDSLPLDIRFAAIDLFRCGMIDPRFSGFFAEEKPQSTIATLLESVNKSEDSPHNLRLTALHLASNVFTSPLYVKELLQADSALLAQMISLITASLLDHSHSTTRVASASLAYNLAAANFRIRRAEKREAMSENQQVELAASLLEVIPSEESEDAGKMMLLALGYLVYCAAPNGELVDLCQALDAKEVLGRCKIQSNIARELKTLF